MVISHSQTKEQSKQWLPKGQPSSAKAKVHVTRTKQMVLAFFDSQSLIYTILFARGTASNIVDVLDWFMKILKKMRLVTDGFYGQLPVHTANVVVLWMAARQIKVIQHPPYSPDLALTYSFLFPR
jgi:hypothetical protein